MDDKTTQTMPLARQHTQETEVAPVPRSPRRRLLPDIAYALSAFPSRCWPSWSG